MAGRTIKTEAVVLRSFRLGEADRVLHLYTLERGRVGAVAKGIRRTKSRFGARLEPLSHVEILIHQGSGELGTVTGVDVIRTHREAREDAYRLGAGLVGLEAMLRLFAEPEPNPRAFEALTKFLNLLDEAPSRVPGRPALDPLVLSFQLKLLWLSGYLPHLTSCADCGGHFSGRGGSDDRADASDTSTKPTQIPLPWRTGAHRKSLKIRLVACRYQECKAPQVNLLTRGKAACKFGLGISRTALVACS